MKILLFGHNYQGSRLEQVRGVLQALSQAHELLVGDSEFYAFLSEALPDVSRRIVPVSCSNGCVADMALSIGGDGTFLRAAEKIGDRGIPVLGVNIGRLGFLADVPAEDTSVVLSEIMAGNYKIEERTLLHVKCDDLPDDFWPYALNEVAVLKQDTSSMISIHTTVGDSYLNTYQADGLIVATPTGSTAYSMSVGGPILMPQSASWVISPVAPHSLTIRPLVVNDDVEITLRVDSRSHSYLLSLDGRSVMLDTATQVMLSKAPFTVKVVKRLGHSFSATLRAKLMWGVDKRE
ncbi:MAG TPA: NAD kinase [Candidatus Barnesiella excrementigallinarum]|nr:NAD kinase [Candidatus Barnesiella excrementigallinarum]